MKATDLERANYDMMAANLTELGGAVLRLATNEGGKGGTTGGIGRELVLRGCLERARRGVLGVVLRVLFGLVSLAVQTGEIGT